MPEILRPAMGRGAWFATCPLIGWRGDPPEGKFCHWCGGPLSGRRLCWCSDECQTVCFQNHSWSYARPAALERDQYACQECGLRQVDVEPVAKLVKVGLWETLLFDEEKLLRAAAGLPRFSYPRETFGIQEFDVLWTQPIRFEVDHIVEIRGKHGQAGCHHHLDGLRTLCSVCHGKKTAAFARTRADERRGMQRLL